MSRSKADLTDRVYRIHGGLSRREARAVVGLVFHRIRSALAFGDPVLISGFGTFRVERRRARLGRNPRTGATVPIGPARRAVFRPSRLMVRGLNAAAAKKGRSDA